MTHGVYSEVGTLRKVIVCRPGLAQARLTPANCHDLLFDDVLWVSQAKTDHYAFVSTMEEHGVEVLEMHDLLADILQGREAREWILERKLTPGVVDAELGAQLVPWLDEMKPEELATRLIGGVVRAELPFTPAGLLAKCTDPAEFLLPPLPNTLFTRDNSCWINDGVALGSMYWPARRQETLLSAAIYRFQPLLSGSTRIWWGDPQVEHGGATLEGGDVMPLTRDVVLIGMGERTSPQGVAQLARALFARESVRHVIAAQLPRSRGDAPRYRIHVLRPRSDHDLSGYRQWHTLLQPETLRRTRQARHSARRRTVLAGGGRRTRPEGATDRRYGRRCVGSRARAMG